MPPSNPRLLLVDDDRELSEMICDYLESDGFAVDVASDGAAGLSGALSGKYDAVILDVMMPQMNGIEVLRELRRESAVPVLMLTAKGDQVERVIGLELGADDYLAKPCYPRELTARLRAILRRHRPAPHQGELHALSDLRVDVPARRATWREESVDLTATEFSMLIALARAGDHVVTKDDLSLFALRRARQPYDRSVDVHISHLRSKLQLATGGLISVETVRGVGYRLALISGEIAA